MMTLVDGYLATDLDKKAIGRRFKEARIRSDLSLREMARQLGYKSATSIV